jgi:hypothetical protein
MSTTEGTAEVSAASKCDGCGAAMYYKPGTHTLVCDFCRSVKEIGQPQERIYSYDYYDFVSGLDDNSVSAMEASAVACSNCSATTIFPPGYTSVRCPFCATPLLSDAFSSRQVIQPHYVLPFPVDKHAAEQRFNQWLRSLWFAPSDLSRKKALGPLHGVYLPHWTYDAQTQTSYSGRRGDYYYETETYKVNGQEKTRRVRKTEWTSVSGHVNCSFADVLVSASPSLDQKTAAALEPWNLDSLVPFDERYFSGFLSEVYRESPVEGLETAKGRMAPDIRNAVCRDIGGDEQRITDMDTSYYNLGIKYIVLPVWLSSYVYRGVTYQFSVNACTGELIAERPWCWKKITGTILTVVVSIFLLWYYSNQH